MSTGYNVTLMHLTADARTVDVLAQIEQRDLESNALQTLLRNFCELDPLANAGVDAEIRVRARGESFLLRSEQGKLVLYDVLDRELPGQVLTPEEAMNELDGTATAARLESKRKARDAAIESFATAPAPAEAVAEPVAAAPVYESTTYATPEPDDYVSPLQPFSYGESDNVVPVFVRPPDRARPRVVAVLAGLTVLLLTATTWLAWPDEGYGVPADFARTSASDVAGLHAALTGVYLTGSEPGQHGIVVGEPGELKIFELGAVEAPRVVHADYRLGRVGGKLCLATNQPGGLIEVAADGNLVYGGEVYQRIP